MAQRVDCSGVAHGGEGAAGEAVELELDRSGGVRRAVDTGHGGAQRQVRVDMNNGARAVVVRLDVADERDQLGPGARAVALDDGEAIAVDVVQYSSLPWTAPLSFLVARRSRSLPS